MRLRDRIVITGIGVCAPNGSSIDEYRTALLTGKSGVINLEARLLGVVPAGVCNFDEFKHQSRSGRRRGTRAGSISIFCASEAIHDSGLSWSSIPKNRVGICIGITEHGNVETEHQLAELVQFKNDIAIWSNYHNTRSIANNPAGEVSICLGITGPHLTIGAACAAGNAGLIHGAQLLTLGDVDIAVAGGVSECIRSFGIFASFQSQKALARHADPTKASRPFDVDRNGIVPAEGGCIFVLERLSDALKRGCRIYGELAGYAMNSDAADLVHPVAERQTECMRLAIERAGILPADIGYVGSHATGTDRGDITECAAIHATFSNGKLPAVTNSKSLIGHTMGAAGALETAALLCAIHDGVIHPTVNLDKIDDRCGSLPIVVGTPLEIGDLQFGIVNSFGMLGINSSVIIARPHL